MGVFLGCVQMFFFWNFLCLVLSSCAVVACFHDVVVFVGRFGSGRACVDVADVPESSSADASGIPGDVHLPDLPCVLFRSLFFFLFGFSVLEFVCTFRSQCRLVVSRMHETFFVYFFDWRCFLGVVR